MRRSRTDRDKTSCDCSRPRLLGYADETVRSGTYGIAVVVVCACQVDLLRHLLRSVVRPGQVRVHFSKEGDRSRKVFLSKIRSCDRTIFFASAEGKEVTARSECWSRLVPKLLAARVAQLTIERLEGSERRDGQDLWRAMRDVASQNRLTYRHADARDEPLLWMADAVAWSAGAGKSWLRRLGPIRRC